MKFNRDLLIDFHRDLRRFDFNTIDQFLEDNHDIYGTVAKFFIALVLLSYENYENLYRPDRTTTYNFLFNHLIKDNSDISDNKMSIITYNYDLSLEEYLFNRINNFVKDKDEVKSIITEMIIHVHGQLGNLDHFEPNGRKYGQLNLEKLAENKIAEGIKIVHEVNEDMLYFKTIKQILNNSDLIYLLGFGYDDLNMRRLELLEIAARNRTSDGGNYRIKGTSYKLRSQRISELRNLISHDIDKSGQLKAIGFLEQDGDFYNLRRT